MSDKLTARLADELNTRGWSMREMARRAGVSHTTIASIMSGRRKATADVCKGIAKALNVPTEDILRLVGLLPPLPDDWQGQFKQVCDKLKNLSPRAREDVVAYVTYRYQQEKTDG